MASSSTPNSNPNYRQIRALYDDETITVYQAYSIAIAEAAVREQKLSASPDFKLSRMTWIKPSWCWMMYRSGYSTKDPRQARILAIKMRHEHFLGLLGQAVVVHGQTLTGAQKEKPIRVQWDPERGPIDKLNDSRSIQIGIGEALSAKWVDEWIVSIEDVSEKALSMHEIVMDGRWTMESLVAAGVMPVERIYEVGDKLRDILEMNVTS